MIISKLHKINNIVKNQNMNIAQVAHYAWPECVFLLKHNFDSTL